MAGYLDLLRQWRAGRRSHVDAATVTGWQVRPGGVDTVVEGRNTLDYPIFDSPSESRQEASGSPHAGRASGSGDEKNEENEFSVPTGNLPGTEKRKNSPAAGGPSDDVVELAKALLGAGAIPTRPLETARGRVENPQRVVRALVAVSRYRLSPESRAAVEAELAAILAALRPTAL